jgi:hypothetical protein
MKKVPIDLVMIRDPSSSEQNPPTSLDPLYKKIPSELESRLESNRIGR